MHSLVCHGRCLSHATCTWQKVQVGWRTYAPPQWSFAHMPTSSHSCSACTQLSWRICSSLVQESWTPVHRKMHAVACSPEAWALLSARASCIFCVCSLVMQLLTREWLKGWLYRDTGTDLCKDVHSDVNWKHALRWTSSHSCSGKVSMAGPSIP